MELDFFLKGTESAEGVLYTSYCVFARARGLFFVKTKKVETQKQRSYLSDRSPIVEHYVCVHDGGMISVVTMPATDIYEVRPVPSGAELLSDRLPFGKLRYGGPNAVENAIGFANQHSRGHATEVRIYDRAGKLIETRKWDPRMEGW